MSVILFAGTEDISFSFVPPLGPFNTNNTWYIETNTATWRAGYSRYALTLQSQGLYNGYLSNSQSFTSSSFWTSGRLRNSTDSNVSTSSALIPMRWCTNDNLTRLRIRFNGTNGSPADLFIVEKLSAAGVATQLGSISTDVFATNAASPPEKIDVFINYAVSGQFSVYRNGKQLFNYTGDVTTDGQTALNYANWGNATVSGNHNWASWSECIVAAIDTRNMSVVTQVPTTGFSQVGLINTNYTQQFWNVVSYQKIVAGYTGTLISASLNLVSSATGTLFLGVYSDSSGSPNTLLASGSVVNPAAGLQTVAMSGTVAITAGTTYWAAQVSTITSINFYGYNGVNGLVQTMSQSTTTLPATATPVFLASGFQNNTWMGFTVSLPANNFTSANPNNTTGNSPTLTPDTSNTANQIQEGPIVGFEQIPIIPGNIVASSFTNGFAAVPATSTKGTILSVVHHAQAGAGPAGPQNFQFLISINGTAYTSSTLGLSAGKTLISYNWDTNPSTSAAWSTADLAVLSPTFLFGYKSIA